MRKIILFTIALVALMTVSCNNKSDENNTKQVPDSLIDVRIAVMPSLDCLPFFVAEKYELFENEGIRVKLKMFNAQMDVDTALVGGSVDFAITDKYRVEKLTARGVQLEKWGTSETNWVLVANKKSRLTKVDQFAEKLVGMTRFSATGNLCEAVFKPLGENTPYYIQVNDINIREKMLINGELDAAWLAEPQATMALCRGGNVVTTENDLGEMGEFVYRVKSRYNINKGDKLRKVYNNACDSINKNGLKTYFSELHKYCGTDTTAVNKLASYKFKKQ